MKNIIDYKKIKSYQSIAYYAEAEFDSYKIQILCTLEILATSILWGRPTELDT